MLNEFSSDRTSKVESDDLSEEKKKEKEVILAKAEQEKELKIQRKVITSKSSIQQFKKVGEIDLEKPVSQKKTEEKKTGFYVRIELRKSHSYTSHFATLANI